MRRTRNPIHIEGPTALRRLTTMIACFLPVVFLLQWRQESTQSGDRPVGSDFKIVAHYYPGDFGGWKPWECTITGDGTVLKSWIRGDRSTKLSDTDVRDLAAKIREARFYQLRSGYSYDVTDNPTLILTVTQNKITQRVSVYAWDFLRERDNREVQRFLRVWAAILRNVPSPNSGDKPDAYEQPSAAEKYRYPTWKASQIPPGPRTGDSKE